MHFKRNPLTGEMVASDVEIRSDGNDILEREKRRQRALNYQEGRKAERQAVSSRTQDDHLPTIKAPLPNRE